MNSSEKKGALAQEEYKHFIFAVLACKTVEEKKKLVIKKIEKKTVGEKIVFLQQVLQGFYQDDELTTDDYRFIHQLLFENVFFENHSYFCHLQAQTSPIQFYTIGLDGLMFQFQNPEFSKNQNAVRGQIEKIYELCRAAFKVMRNNDAEQMAHQHGFLIRFSLFLAYQLELKNNALRPNLEYNNYLNCLAQMDASLAKNNIKSSSLAKEVMKLCQSMIHLVNFYHYKTPESYDNAFKIQAYDGLALSTFESLTDKILRCKQQLFSKKANKTISVDSFALYQMLSNPQHHQTSLILQLSTFSHLAQAHMHKRKQEQDIAWQNIFNFKPNSDRPSHFLRNGPVIQLNPKAFFNLNDELEKEKQKQRLQEKKQKLQEELIAEEEKASSKKLHKGKKRLSQKKRKKLVKVPKPSCLPPQLTRSHTASLSTSSTKANHSNRNAFKNVQLLYAKLSYAIPIDLYVPEITTLTAQTDAAKLESLHYQLSHFEQFIETAGLGGPTTLVLPKEVQESIKALVQRLGGENIVKTLQLQVYGGAIRDTLLGQKPHDFDLRTHLPLAKVMTHLKKANINIKREDISKGRIHIRLQDEKIQTDDLLTIVTNATDNVKTLPINSGYFSLSEAYGAKTCCIYSVQSNQAFNIISILKDPLGSHSDKALTAWIRQNPIRLLRAAYSLFRISKNENSHYFQTTLQSICNAANHLEYEATPEQTINRMLKIIKENPQTFFNQFIASPIVHKVFFPNSKQSINNDLNDELITLAQINTEAALAQLIAYESSSQFSEKVTAQQLHKRLIETPFSSKTSFLLFNKITDCLKEKDLYCESKNKTVIKNHSVFKPVIIISDDHQRNDNASSKSF